MDKTMNVMSNNANVIETFNTYTGVTKRNPTKVGITQLGRLMVEDFVLSHNYPEWVKDIISGWARPENVLSALRREIRQGDLLDEQEIDFLEGVKYDFYTEVYLPWKKEDERRKQARKERSSK